MKPVSIDFADARHPWRWDVRMPATRLALAVAVLSAAALAIAWSQARALERQTQVLQAELARLAQQRAHATRQRAASDSSSEHAAVLHKAAAQRALPWEAIFRAFESAPTARLESWAPDFTIGIVKVQAQADDIGQVQDYLAILQDSPVFTRVSLQRHELPSQGSGVNFTYEAVLAPSYRLPDNPARSVP